MRRNENSARENKNALAQLISHTKNVERAVTMSQQDIAAKKEAQAEKLQELKTKISTVETHSKQTERIAAGCRDSILDITGKMDNQGLEIKDCQAALRLQNKMYDNQVARMKQQENESGKVAKDITETQRVALETKISGLQQGIMEVQSKLNHEIKDRELDFAALENKINNLDIDVKDTKTKRDKDVRDMETNIKGVAKMKDSEKQSIVVQISAVQTELKQAIAERDNKFYSKIEKRVGNCEAILENSIAANAEFEKDIRGQVKSVNDQLTVYMDETTDSMRKMTEADQETLRNRIHEATETTKSIESEVAELRMELTEGLARIDDEKAGKEKVLEAKLEDMNDRLRLGMNKLQGAIGEARVANSNAKGRRRQDDDDDDEDDEDDDDDDDDGDDGDDHDHGDMIMMMMMMMMMIPQSEASL